MEKDDCAKRGLVLVFDPHNLYEFIWYYKAYASDYLWTALCMPNDAKKEYMSSYCERTEIFDEVLRTDDISYEARSTKEKIAIFLKMFFCWCIGQRKLLCKRIIGQYVDIAKYDRIVIISEGGIVTGAIAALADEKDVVILDDGMRDYYGKRTYRNLLKKEGREWVAVLLSYMGYASPYALYPFKKLKYCTKLLVRPDSRLAIPYAYKKVYKAYDDKVLPLSKCRNIYEKIYPTIDSKSVAEADAIFLLSDYYFFTSKSDDYVKRIIKYINDNFKGKRIVVKAHPMDVTKYSFDKEVQVYELERSIPGEVIIPYIEGKAIYCLYSTTMLMFMQKNKICLLYFENLVNERDCDIAKFRYDTQQEFLLEFVDNYTITYIK